MFVENNAAIERQKQAPIHVIVGNPPYSVGQTSANDNNQNVKYPTLDHRIEETYAKKSTATNKNSLYDSYLRAFRWATDRIGDQGVVAFVSNGGWLDANTGDGVRLSFAEDFTDVYVFNLRGNQRTAGELSRKEGGKVFGSGSRNTVAIMFGIKDPSCTGCRIHYRDIGDYLTAEKKLEIVSKSSVESLPWREIEPNRYGDWLNQRSEEFETWPALGEKKNKQAVRFFTSYSSGLQTNRDPWVYNFSKEALDVSVKRLIDNYNQFLDPYRQWRSAEDVKSNEKAVAAFLKEVPGHDDPTKIKWTSSMSAYLSREIQLNASSGSLMRGMYRPFNNQYVFFDEFVNHRRGQLPSMFPTPEHDNIGFYIPAASSASRDFNALATNLLPDLCLSGSGSGQFFPRWTWDRVEVSDGELDLALGWDPSASEKGKEGEILSGYRRVDNVTDEILAEYRQALGDVSKDDIIYFVYGQLHDPEYRLKYAADLKKMLPHIETPTSRERFDKVAAAGRELMDLHIGYEDVEPYPLDVQVKEGFSEDDRETWRVTKMKWAKRKDPETAKTANDTTKIIYNTKVTISGIPAVAEEYMLGSRSALAWVIDRYQVKKDKASGIVNDPNDWADEVGNPRYIVDLIGKVTRVAVETVRIVKGL